MPQIQTQNKTHTDVRTPTPSNHLLLPLGITASHSSTHSQSTCTKLKDEVSILSSCSAHSIRSVQCVRKTAHDDAVWRLLNFNPYFHSTNTYRETHRRKPAAKQHHQLTRTHTHTLTEEGCKTFTAILSGCQYLFVMVVVVAVANFKLIH